MQLKHSIQSLIQSISTQPRRGKGTGGGGGRRGPPRSIMLNLHIKKQQPEKELTAGILNKETAPYKRLNRPEEVDSPENLHSVLFRLIKKRFV